MEKLIDTIDNLNKLERWLMFIEYAGDKEKQEIIEKLKEEDGDIEMAVTVLKEASYDEQMRARYLSRHMFILDYNTSMREAREEGIKEGIKEEKYNTAKNMLKLELPVELIAKSTGLTIEEIEKIK